VGGTRGAPDCDGGRPGRCEEEEEEDEDEDEEEEEEAPAPASLSSSASAPSFSFSVSPRTRTASLWKGRSVETIASSFLESETLLPH
jgi:hypothetical protein